MTIDLTPRYTQIHHLIASHGGYLPVQEVQTLLSEFDITMDQLLLALLPLVSETALMPISHFKVGAIAVGATGNLYFGANQEYFTAPLNHAVHAEQAAVAMAHLHGETSIVKMTASARPCGHCRQFLNELSEASALEVLLPEGNVIKLTELLPYAFGPKELGVRGGLLSAAQQQLRLIQSSQDELVALALHAANKSYSPYAQAYAGAAMRTKDRKMFSGSYLENAGFNPSLPALQAAFVHLVQSNERYENVSEIILVQAQGGAVNHAAMTEMTLKTVCPQVKLYVYEAGI